MNAAGEKNPGTKFPRLFARLAAKFSKDEVKVLVKGNTPISYVTARTVMNRLDEVLGNENWWDNYTPLGAESVLCHLTLRLPDGSTLTKCDAGGSAMMKDQGDDDKSMISDALKRAAGRFGIGRYLYNDGVAPFVREELTKARDERLAAKGGAEETRPTPDLEDRSAVNAAFPAAGRPAENKPRPANDREPVPLRGDRINARGVDGRAWYHLIEQEVDAVNRAVLGHRLGHNLNAAEALNAIQATRHMAKWARESGAEDHPEPEIGDGKFKRVKVGELGAFLSRLYTLWPDWRDGMREELARYLAEAEYGAMQVADNEIYGDKPQDDEPARGDLVPADEIADGWAPGRE